MGPESFYSFFAVSMTVALGTKAPLDYSAWVPGGAGTFSTRS